MKAKNIYSVDDADFPLYCNFYSSFEPCILIDTRNGEVWCDTRPKSSCSPDEWHGYVTRIKINGDFIDDDDVYNFIDDNLNLIEKYLNDEISYECFENGIVENSHWWNDEKIIVESFCEYREVCNLGMTDIDRELETFNYDIREYAEDCVDNRNGCVYFKDCTSEEIEDQVVQYLNEDYEAVFKDESGYHKSLRLIVEQNWDNLIKETDKQKVSDIFFKNGRSENTDIIFEMIQKVKADELDYDEMIEKLER